MDIHKNARLTVYSRAELVRRALDERQPPKAVATALAVCERTVRKWVARFRAEGPAGLADRSSRPARLYRPTPKAQVERVGSLRRQRWTGRQIAKEVGVSPATVSRILKRLGLNRLKALEPAQPIRRYQRERPGELIHIDINKLGRFASVGHRITGDRTGQSRTRGIGWEFVHVCIDDNSRFAFSQILPDERKASAVPFLEAAVAYYNGLGRDLPGFFGSKEHAFEELFAKINAAFCCAALGIKPTVQHADYIGSWLEGCAGTIAPSSAPPARRAKRPTCYCHKHAVRLSYHAMGYTPLRCHAGSALGSCGLSSPVLQALRSPKFRRCL